MANDTKQTLGTYIGGDPKIQIAGGTGKPTSISMTSTGAGQWTITDSDGNPLTPMDPPAPPDTYAMNQPTRSEEPGAGVATVTITDGRSPPTATDAEAYQSKKLDNHSTSIPIDALPGPNAVYSFRLVDDPSTAPVIPGTFYHLRSQAHPDLYLCYNYNPTWDPGQPATATPLDNSALPAYLWGVVNGVVNGGSSSEWLLFNCATGAALSWFTNWNGVQGNGKWNNSNNFGWSWNSSNQTLSGGGRSDKLLTTDSSGNLTTASSVDSSSQWTFVPVGLVGVVYNSGA